VTGNLEKAQQTCESWAQTYPRDVNAHGFLAGMIYPVFAKYEKALEESRKAVGLDPDNPKYSRVMSQVLACDLALTEGTLYEQS